MVKISIGGASASYWSLLCFSKSSPIVETSRELASRRSRLHAEVIESRLVSCFGRRTRSIDRGLRNTGAGRLATDEEDERAFAQFRRK